MSLTEEQVPVVMIFFRHGGPSVFTVKGSLKTWSIIPELHKINIPTLLLNGRYDGANEKAVMPFFKNIPHVKWYTFAESSHLPHWEERAKFMELVSDFLLL